MPSNIEKSGQLSNGADKQRDTPTEKSENQDLELQWLAFIEDDKKWKKIDHYALLWNTNKHKGIIKILLEDGVDYKIVVKSAREFEMIANVFRIEKSVYYNLISGSIASSWTPMSGEVAEIS